MTVTATLVGGTDFGRTMYVPSSSQIDVTGRVDRRLKYPPFGYRTRVPFLFRAPAALLAGFSHVNFDAWCVCIMRKPERNQICSSRLVCFVVVSMMMMMPPFPPRHPPRPVLSSPG